jgi:ABC-2 type transport system ATP-binding protein
MAVLEARDLTKRFASLTAVDGLSLSIEPAEVFGLLGPNGAGKTTSVKMLTTLLPPTSGEAQVCGFDVVSQSRQVRRLIGYVPQMISADGSLTGFENLLIFAKLYELPRAGRRDRVEEALRFMGLSDSAGKLVRQYSGGMIRRLEIAQSTLHNPRVLFLDEPTVGLDPAARRAVWKHVLGMREMLGVTVILTTHLMEEAESFCDRVAIMHQGRVAALDTPAALKAAVGGAATLDDVFIHYTGENLESGGSYRDARRTRRAVRRLG